MKTIACVGCGNEVAVPDSFVGRRGECPLCGARFEVPEGSDSGEPEVEAPRSRWPFAPPRFEWPFRGPRARRCVDCQRNQFLLPDPCKFCGGETVGLDVAGVVEGRDREAVATHRDFRRHARLLQSADATIWGVAAGIVVLLLFETMRNRWWIANLFFFAALAAPVVAGAAWLHAKAVAFIAARFAARHGEGPSEGAEDAPRGALIGRLREGIVEPFLDRHEIAENTPAWAPEGERELLRQLLAREGLPMDPRALRTFLTACAFRRDFNRFRGRLADAGGDAPIASYARIAPEGADDAMNLPYLQQVLAEAGREADEGHVAAVLRDVRRDRALKSFEADLRDRKPAGPAPAAPTPPGVVVSIEQVERMDPHNFERLAGMIYQSLGYFAPRPRRRATGGPTSCWRRTASGRSCARRCTRTRWGRGRYGKSRPPGPSTTAGAPILLSTHHFPPAAVDQAGRGGVTLVDREGLIALLDDFNRAPKDQAQPGAPPAVEGAGVGGNPPLVGRVICSSRDHRAPPGSLGGANRHQSPCFSRSLGERRSMSWARSNSSSHSATAAAIAPSEGGTRPVGHEGPSCSMASWR